MIKEFKEFISKGNVLDLAVAVIIGAAFGAIVTSFSKDILGQLIAAIGGTPDFATFTIGLREVTDAKGNVTKVGLNVGAFINAVINFLIIAFAMFLVVKGVNKAQALGSKTVEEAEEEATDEVLLLQEIRDLLAAQSRT